MAHLGESGQGGADLEGSRPASRERQRSLECTAGRLELTAPRLEPSAREVPDHRHEVLAEPAVVAERDRVARALLRLLLLALLGVREREVAERVALPELVLVAVGEAQG